MRIRSAAPISLWMAVRIRVKMAQRKILAWPLLGLQPLLAVERLVANDGWVASPVKAVSRRRRGPQARLYRTCHPAILGHRGRRLNTATPFPSPSLRGFAPPVTLLNDRGGSDSIQIAPAALRFTKGQDQIEGLRLTPKGLYRWYAKCCNTPVGNTRAPALPFVSMLVQA
jgi:Family of unknown function (DUF6151)